MNFFVATFHYQPQNTLRICGYAVWVGDWEKYLSIPPPPLIQLNYNLVQPIDVAIVWKWATSSDYVMILPVNILRCPVSCKFPPSSWVSTARTSIYFPHGQSRRLEPGAKKRSCDSTFLSSIDAFKHDSLQFSPLPLTRQCLAQEISASVGENAVRSGTRNTFQSRFSKNI